MRVVKVIEYKCWRHKATGRQVSIHGCAPWVTEKERADWELAVMGWTWENDNGTYGLGRMPAKTREEAVEVMKRFNGGGT